MAYTGIIEKGVGHRPECRPKEVSMTSFAFDLSRGVDVLSGSKVLAHFDGANALAQAWALAQERPGRWVRYWLPQA